MGRRRAVSAVIDPDTGKKIQDWGRTVWWYVVRRDEFPVSYWNGTRWAGSFRDYAAKYRTKEKAEKVAVLLAAKEPNLIGVIDVIEK